VYVIKDLRLIDYIEGVWAEDVTVKAQFTYGEIKDPFPSP